MKKPKSKWSGSGSRRHLLVFEKLTETKDESTGSITELWRKDFAEYGELTTGKSDEVFESQRRNALSTWPQYVPSETYIFRLPYRSDIKPLLHRLKFDGKIYNIFPPVRGNRPAEMFLQVVLYQDVN